MWGRHDTRVARTSEDRVELVNMARRIQLQGCGGAGRGACEGESEGEQCECPE